MIFPLQMNRVHVFPQLSLLNVAHLTVVALMVDPLSVNFFVGVKAGECLEHGATFIATDGTLGGVNLAMCLKLIAILAQLLADFTLIDFLAVDLHNRESFVEILFSLVRSLFSFVTTLRRFLVSLRRFCKFVKDV